MKSSVLSQDPGVSGGARALVSLTTTELAVALRERQVSAVEVLEAFLARAHEHNPALNAVVTWDEARARARAREADAALARGESWGPLHGVPFTVKDAFSTEGLRTTSAHPALAEYVPSRDATVVARLKAAGGILWGKTNLPPFAADLQTHGPLWGRTNNPHDVGRTPGGSSGGAAAAVAAGLTPFEVGSDIGGSIRQPAHYCGVVGIKPTEHRVSNAGHIPDLPDGPRNVRHMACSGPLARSVADLRLILSVIEGADPRNPEVPPVAPLGAAKPRALNGLRLAWADTLGPFQADRETRQVFQRFTAAARAEGVVVERAVPPGQDFADLVEVWGLMEGGEVGAPLRPPERAAFRDQFLPFEHDDLMARAIIQGIRLDLTGYGDALTRRDAHIVTLEGFLSGWDAWLVPVALTAAPPHTPFGGLLEVDGAPRSYLEALGGFTCLFNATGNPVVVFPLGRTEAGLPVGAQLVGRRWADGALLDVAEALLPLGGGVRWPSAFTP
ncbi:amidase [Corallococcus sp. Z5C101001]|uniref:amidase n=1 Tax=Corallococcus sp. Z5C101001 TaxID=2596829 RepID=UPI00117D7D76|nr:amidase [Corallococcus sp. Z5C101001]TSC32707.1 amidase [Corallococcus sp. Z5C101001]